MSDTPSVSDGADASLRKAVSLLNKIEAKTGSATITGPVTVTNEVEIKNDANNPLPVSDNGGSLTVDGTVELGATSLSALENISVTFPATQNVNVTNAGLSVSVSNLPAIQPVSGSVSLTTDIVVGETARIFVKDSPGNFTAFYEKENPTSTTFKGSGDNVLLWTGTRWQISGDNSALWAFNNSANQTSARIPRVGWQQGDYPLYSLEFIIAQSVSVTSFDAYMPVLGSGADAAAGGDVTGTTVIGILKRGLTHLSSLIAKLPNLISNRIPVDGSGVTQPVSLASVPSHPVTGPLTDTQLRAAAVPVSLASVPSHAVTGPLTDTQLRATAVPVSGTVTANTGLTQPLTDTQLRQTAVPVSGTVTSRIADGAGNNLTSAARGSERALSVQIVDASGAQVTSFGGGGGGGTVTATQTTPSALKAQAQILDATGLQMSFVNAGIAGTPSVDVLTVQGSTSGTPIPVQVASYSVATSVQFSNFTGTTSTAIAGVDANRKVLTIFNEGNGTLYVKPAAYAGDVVSTSSYQIRMSPGDYWEVPKEQLRFQHLGIFATVGTARITSIS